MIAVWKYIVEVDGPPVEMPTGAEILTAQMQGGDICIWARVNTEMQPEQRTIIIAATGEGISPGLAYIGTVISPRTGLVWHLFERV